MRIECIILGVVFSFAGYFFAFRKGYKHLFAWKKMSDKEKSRIQIKALSRNIGGMIMLNGVIFLIKGLWQRFDNHCFTIAIIAWFIAAALDLIYISRSKRYIRQ